MTINIQGKLIQNLNNLKREVNTLSEDQKKKTAQLVKLRKRLGQLKLHHENPSLSTDEAKLEDKVFLHFTPKVPKTALRIHKKNKRTHKARRGVRQGNFTKKQIKRIHRIFGAEFLLLILRNPRKGNYPVNKRNEIIGGGNRANSSIRANETTIKRGRSKIKIRKTKKSLGND
jgi:hypothetical protein